MTFHKKKKETEASFFLYFMLYAFSFRLKFPEIVFFLHKFKLRPFGCPDSFAPGFSVGLIDLENRFIIRVLDLSNRPVKESQQKRIRKVFVLRGVLAVKPDCFLWMVSEHSFEVLVFEPS